MITVLGNRLSLDELRHIPVERPENAGRRWQGIHHHSLATCILNGLTSRGIEPTSQTWATDKTGSALVGGITVNFPSFYNIPNIEGMRYSLALRHDNAMHRALTFAVGTQVMVCCNGVLTGEYVLTRRHTVGMDLDRETNLGVSRFLQEAGKVRDVIAALKEKRLTGRQVDHRLMEAGRQRLLPWSHVGQVYQEYTEPRHAEFRQDNAWALYNAFGEIVKKSNPQRQLRSLNAFREVVLN